MIVTFSMAIEREVKDGVPSNTNPFCVVCDILGDFGHHDDPGIREHYIRIDVDIPYAPEDIRGPALSQEEAERLVRAIYEKDTLGSRSMGGAIAVRSEYAHIIPADMEDEVPVVDSKDTLDGRCEYSHVR